MKRAGLAFLMTLSMGCAAPALAQPAGTPAEQGGVLYGQNCTACHGANGGAGDRAPAIVLAGANTVLRGQRSDAQLLTIIRNGIPGTAMPAWSGKMSDDDISKIGAYIHALRGTALDNPLPGNAAHGEEVFWGKGQCGTCHAIAGRGNAAGPDLTDLAAMRKTVAIENALTKTEHRVFGDGGVHLPSLPPMDDETIHVVTRGGQAMDGLMRNQDAWSVQFVTMDGAFHSLDRSELRSITVKRGGVMPTDYDKKLSPDEFKDLMAFLTRQGKKPELKGE
jgi:putative heme-binding domain-containing protein